jgi:hypothetical protein
MPVNPEIRQLAADPDFVRGIRMIDLCFESMAERNTDPTLSAEEMIERCWRMMKRGILRLYDPEADDDDALFIQEPRRRTSARVLALWAPSCSRSGSTSAACKM